MPTGIVLVVDDSEDDAMLLGYALRAANADTTVLRVDTISALQEACRHAVDVVLVDCCIPGMTTRRSLEIVRRHLPTVPLALWSGVSEEELAAIARENEVPWYFSKDNMRKVATWLQRKITSPEADKDN